MTQIFSAIEDVYIKPIKSVLFVDDDFPTYESLVSGTVQAHLQDEEFDAQGATAHEEIRDQAGFVKASSEPLQTPTHQSAITPRDRIAALVSSCREEGYLVDVEQDYSCAQKYINSADLIVLDYYLAGDAGTSEQALAIIHTLANTPRRNLVVVYTTLESRGVATEIAYSLTKPVRESKLGLHSHAGSDGFVEENFHLFLENPCTAISKMKIEVENIPHKFNCRELFRRKLQEKFPSTKHAEQDMLLQCCLSSEHPWLISKNVFVVVVKKDQESLPSMGILLNPLRDALVEYNPTITTLVLQKCINATIEHTYEIFARAFPSEIEKAAILYYTLYGDAPAIDVSNSLDIRATSLMQNIFSNLPNGLLSHSRDFINLIMQDMICIESHNRIAEVLNKEKIREIDEFKFILQTNAFLCCERQLPQHITTGTIFSIDASSALWVCVSPACDMMPHGGVAGGTKVKRIDGLRLLLCPSSQYEALLENATHSRHLYIKKLCSADISVFEIHPKGSEKVHVEAFFCTGEGLLDASAKVSLSRVKAQNGTLSMNDVEATIVAQLRPEYASRLLTRKGAWTSRIGVDFLNYP